MHPHPVRTFRLSPPGKGRGVSCDASGAFIDSVPLLKRTTANGKDVWAPRDGAELSDALSKHYDLPIDISSRARGLAAIARALNEDSVARAQLAALFLHFPDPPSLAKRTAAREERIRFIQDLHASDLLKARWNVHWPAHAPDSQGGRFAPKTANLEGQSAPNQAPGVSAGTKPSSPAPKQLRPWSDIAELKDARPVVGIPLWAIPMIGPEMAETEIAEEFVTALRPGRFARQSIRASGPKVSEGEQPQVNQIGRSSGCHTCGTRNPGTSNGNWIGDHQPPTRLNPPLKPQRLYPHCKACSLRQGGEVTQFLQRAGEEFWEWYQSYASKNVRSPNRAALRVLSPSPQKREQLYRPVAGNRSSQDSGPSDQTPNTN